MSTPNPVPFRDTTPGALTPTGEERSLAVLGHLAGIIAAVVSAGWLSIVGPFAIWAIYKERSPFVRQAAAASFNFNLVLWAMAVGGWVLAITVVLLPIALIVWAVAVVAGVWFHVRAALAANRGEAYTYPWAITVLR